MSFSTVVRDHLWTSFTSKISLRLFEALVNLVLTTAFLFYWLSWSKLFTG